MDNILVMEKITNGDNSIFFVPPGGRKVSSGRHKILAASLGSCVGLGLMDKKSNIAGLAHIVIPECPLHAEEAPYMCAETALKLLLDEMLKKGAKKEYLEAGICGGISLKSPWIHDLGVKSVEILRQKLKEENIPLSYIEPVEHLVSSFIIDLETKSFGCKNIFIEQRPTKEGETQYIDINSILKKMKPIPSVVTKVVGLMGQQHYEIMEVVEEVKKDEIMVGKLLKTCNSPAFAPVKKIDSVEKAVIFLGSRNLLKIILSVYMENFYGDFQGHNLRKNGMYHHSLAVAIFSQKLCEITNLPQDVGYTCGLLHDIGKRALDVSINNKKQDYYKLIIENKDTISVERELFSIDHCTLGKIISKKWNFPENITNVISMHHFVKTDSDNMIKSIYLADILSHHFLSGFIIAGCSTSSFHEIMNSLGITYGHLTNIIKNIPYNIFSND